MLKKLPPLLELVEVQGNYSLLLIMDIRIGTKAGRITRVIRLIRLIRIVKLYKNANTVLTKDETGLIDENQIKPVNNALDS